MRLWCLPVFKPKVQRLAKDNMWFRWLRSLLVPACLLVSLAWGQGTSQPLPGSTDASSGVLAKVPSGVILVKGAWSSASDSVTPLPEDGKVANAIFSDPYFGITYAFPPDWTEKYKGPPPSDRGRYVLAQLSLSGTFKGSIRGNILITAQDLFFAAAPADNAMELIDSMRDNLHADYKVESPPTAIKIGGHPFIYFAYWSPVAQLHWYVLATEIRCHAVEFVLSSRDTTLPQNLMQDLNKMKLPAETDPAGGAVGKDFPFCVKNYAREENMMARVDPIFTDHKFNRVPVRIIIDKEGKIKHIHFLSAFSDQAKAITDALGQWRFKPYRRDGQPVEVETGILFGPAASTIAPQPARAANE